VLAFPNGAAPEIIEDGVTGYLCSDEQDMTARVPDALTLDRAACREGVLSRFSTARVVEDHLAMYELAISSLKHGRRVPEEARSRPPRLQVAR
jgi:glycosyltransferase involved in cell wall biosynthesis